MKNLIREFEMDCPICDKVHLIKEYEATSTAIVKGEDVEYIEKYFYCENAKEDERIFVNGKLLGENLLNGRNAYRKKHGLLTSYEIADIRKKYGLTQVEFARLLGWGDVTIQRYETKAIQDETYDSILKRFREDISFVSELLQKNRNTLSSEKVKKLSEKIKSKEVEAEEFDRRTVLKKDYVNFITASAMNGFKNTLDFDKIEAVVSYIAKKIPSLFKVKLMKMLWYTDMLEYRKNHISMTGIVYTHEAMGALPIGHRDLMMLPGINVVEEMSPDFNSMFHIFPNPDVDMSVLTEDNKEILNMVVKKFKDFSTKEIVEYMHKEKAYMETTLGDVISYEYARELNEF